MDQYRSELVERPSEVVVRVAGEIDLDTAPLFERDLTEATAGRPRRLVIDLSAADFFDVRGLDAVLAARSELAPPQEVVIEGASPLVRNLFEMTAGSGIVVHESESPAPPV